MTRTHLAATVATAAAGAALALAGAAGASGQDAAPATTLRLSARTTALNIVDAAPRRRVSSADALVTVSALSDAAGTRVGAGHLVCAVTRPARSFERATFQCDGTHRLRDGTLTFSLLARLGADRVITAAITGGTGAYAGARGELVNTARSEAVSDQVITLRP